MENNPTHFWCSKHVSDFEKQGDNLNVQVQNLHILYLKHAMHENRTISSSILAGIENSPSLRSKNQPAAVIKQICIYQSTPLWLRIRAKTD